MRVAFLGTPRERTMNVPETWPVPRIGEAVAFCDGPSWLVLDVLYTYPRESTSVVVIIRLSEEERSCSTLTKN